MKLTIDSTDIITHVNGIPARVWRGVTDAGGRCLLLIPAIAVDPKFASEFDGVLAEISPPNEYRTFSDALDRAEATFPS